LQRADVGQEGKAVGPGDVQEIDGVAEVIDTDGLAAL
jgi:hypothetical protein